MSELLDDFVTLKKSSASRTLRYESRIVAFKTTQKIFSGIADSKTLPLMSIRGTDLVNDRVLMSGFSSRFFHICLQHICRGVV